MPPVVSIISKKNCGKTTLIEKLLPELKRRGYRVGTIKHDTHGYTIDHKGKDTWRHKQAGSDVVAISSPWMLSLIRDVAEEIDLDEIVARYFDDVDLVITEGYKKASKPQIEVFRQAAHSKPLHSQGHEGTLVAFVSDIPLETALPCFDLNDIKGVTDFLEQVFLRP